MLPGYLLCQQTPTLCYHSNVGNLGSYLIYQQEYITGGPRKVSVLLFI